MPAAGANVIPADAGTSAALVSALVAAVDRAARAELANETTAAELSRMRAELANERAEHEATRAELLAARKGWARAHAGWMQARYYLDKATAAAG